MIKLLKYWSLCAILKAHNKAKSIEAIDGKDDYYEVRMHNLRIYL